MCWFTYTYSSVLCCSVLPAGPLVTQTSLGLLPSTPPFPLTPLLLTSLYFYEYFSQSDDYLLIFYTGHFNEQSFKSHDVPLTIIFLLRNIAILKCFKHFVLLFYLNVKALVSTFTPESHFRNNFHVRYMGKESCTVLLLNHRFIKA